MFILEFGVSKSKKYDLAIDIAKTFDSFREAYLEKPNKITLLPNEIKYELDRLRKLLSIISNWKNVNATFLGNKVNPFEFVYHNIELHECHNNYTHSAIQDKYCSVWLDSWGCKFIKSPIRHFTKWINYKGLKFWYNYGYFESENIWIIDKMALKEKLMCDIERKNLRECSMFSLLKIEQSLADLPDKIEIDNVYWEIFYENKYENGIFVSKPTNIRHIIDNNPHIHSINMIAGK